MSEDVTSHRFKNQMSLCLLNLRVLLVGSLESHTIYCLDMCLSLITISNHGSNWTEAVSTSSNTSQNNYFKKKLNHSSAGWPSSTSIGQTSFLFYLSTLIISNHGSFRVYRYLGLLHVCHCLPFAWSKFSSKDQQERQAQTNNSTSQRGGFESRFAHTQTVKGTVDLRPIGGAIHFKGEQVGKDQEDVWCLFCPNLCELLQPFPTTFCQKNRKIPKIIQNICSWRSASPKRSLFLCSSVNCPPSAVSSGRWTP